MYKMKEICMTGIIAIDIISDEISISERLFFL